MEEPGEMANTAESQVPKIPPFSHFKAKGSVVRAFLLVALAFIPTAAYLENSKIDRYLAQLESLRLRYSNYRRQRVLEWLKDCGDDPRVTAAFKSELVLLGTSKYISSKYNIERTLFIISPRLKEKKPEASIAYFEALLRIYAHHEIDVCLEIIKAYGPELHDKLRQASRSIKDVKLRYGALLVICSINAGSVEDIPAILKGAEAESPAPSEEALIARAIDTKSPSAISQTFNPSSRHKAARRALVALGNDAIPYLIKGFESRSRGVANLCASVLKDLDRGMLVKQIEKKIDAYNIKGLYLSWASQVIYTDQFYRVNPLKKLKAKYVPPAKDVKTAQKIFGEALHLSYLVAEGLQALLDVRGDQKVDLCFMRALSSHNEAVAKFCASELKRRLKRPQFVDTIFKFLVHKSEFKMKEIEVYEDALKTYKKAASVDICRNLEALLKRAGNSPAKVYWIHKAIALRCLKTVGQSSAFSTIQKFSRDPTHYVFYTSRKSQFGPATRKEIKVYYRSLCKEALTAIAKNENKAAPALLKLDPYPTQLLPRKTDKKTAKKLSLEETKKLLEQLKKRNQKSNKKDASKERKKGAGNE
jgi:hypothetical protein